MRGARADHGSVAGLRFARSEFPGTPAAPLETQVFRTNLRLRLYESAIAAKRAKVKTPDLEEALADERDEVEPDIVGSWVPIT